MDNSQDIKSPFSGQTSGEGRIETGGDDLDNMTSTKIRKEQQKLFYPTDGMKKLNKMRDQFLDAADLKSAENSRQTSQSRIRGVKFKEEQSSVYSSVATLETGMNQAS